MQARAKTLQIFLPSGAFVLQELHGYAAELERLQNANPSVIKVLRKAAAAHTKK